MAGNLGKSQSKYLPGTSLLHHCCISLLSAYQSKGIGQEF